MGNYNSEVMFPPERKARLVLISLNVVVNIWNAIVFKNKLFKNTSFSFYLFCLAITDLIGSISLFFVEFYIFIVQIEFFCKTADYIIETCEYFSPWILVLLAIDRALSMKNMKLSTKLNKKWTRIGLVFAVTLPFLIPAIPWILFKKIGNEFSDVACYINEEAVSSKAYNVNTIVSDMFTIVLKASVPFLLMTSANIYTAVVLCRSKMKFKINLKKEKAFVASTLFLNFLFICCRLPHSILASWIRADNLLRMGTGRLTYNVYLHLSRLQIAISILVFLKIMFPLFQTFVFIFINKIYRRVCINFLKPTISCFNKKK